MAYYDLSSVPTTQLSTLTPASGVPAQAVTAEMLRRSQTQNASGYSGLPVLATAHGPLPLVPATPGATYEQENFGYPPLNLTAPTPRSVGLSAAQAVGNLVGGGPGAVLARIGADTAATAVDKKLPEVVRAAADAMHTDTAPVNMVPPDALPPNLPPDATAADNADLAALLKSIPSGADVKINPVAVDWDKYKEQVKAELPDNLSGIADALSEQKTKLTKREKNALSQGLLAAGLSMLASRGSFFNALGNAGKEGLSQYNQQKQSAEVAQQALLSDQLRLAQTQQANNQAVVQAATQRATEDARVQQVNDQLRIQAALARQNPAMLRAQIGLMRLSMAKSPYQDMADKDYHETLDLYGKSLIPGMPGSEEKMQLIQLYATQRRNAILRGMSPEQIPFPSSRTPAAVRAQ